MPDELNQRFHKGDHVKVADDLGSEMSHFQAGCEAIVVGSYADQFGGSDKHSLSIYTLFIKDGGECSWYPGEYLTMVESGRIDLLETWKLERDARDAKRSDLDWIFANGHEVFEKGYGASLAALGICLGIKNMWGSRGEGITLYYNRSVHERRT